LRRCPGWLEGPIELPHHEHVARLYKRQRLDQPHSIALGAGGVIFEQVPAVNPRRQQRVALKIRGLSIRLGRDAHVPDLYRRETPKSRFPYGRLRRLSEILGAAIDATKSRSRIEVRNATRRFGALLREPDRDCFAD
jgi:hypothetical protein